MIFITDIQAYKKYFKIYWLNLQFVVRLLLYPFRVGQEFGSTKKKMEDQFKKSSQLQMKTMKKLFILFIAVAGFSVSTYAQGSATANLVVPISIAATRASLNFGTIARDASATGTVTIAANANGDRSSTVVDLVGLPTGNSSQFTVTSQGGLAFTWVTAASTTISNSGGTTLNVTEITSSSHGTLASEIIYVGAKLTIPNDATVGVYNGTYSVTATYD